MSLHLLRPEWCWAYLPWIILAIFLIKTSNSSRALLSICDAHLIPYVIHRREKYSFSVVLCSSMLSAALMIFSLSGPSWSRVAVAAIVVEHPRVLLLSLSSSMLAHDISPDRLSRAKFNLHNLLRFPGTWGLIVYTSEPFILAPLTQDGQTIDEWVDALYPAVMPVMGNRLDLALSAADKLMSESGFQQGDVLVLTDTAPDKAAINAAHTLFTRGLHVSIIPLSIGKKLPIGFMDFVQHGGGQIIDYQDNQTMISHWLKQGAVQNAPSMTNMSLSRWQDQGRVFLIPAFLCLLPVFRRGAKPGLVR